MSTKRGGLSAEDPDIHNACDMCAISLSWRVDIVSCHVCMRGGAVCGDVILYYIVRLR